jgi:RNA polymerase sigma factor (sigma-70 family)
VDNFPPIARPASTADRLYSPAVGDHLTTQAVQRYLDELAGVSGNSPAEPLIRALMASAVDRLHLLCATMLHRSYPRLTRGPLNLETDEVLGAVVERLLKAMRSVRPHTVRQFFALANQHMRWELNDLARRLDEKEAAVELRDSLAQPPADLQSSGAQQPGPNAGRILLAIEGLPDDEREAFNLVRVQGMTQPEAAHILGVSSKTVQRRLNRSLLLLSQRLADLKPADPPPPLSPSTLASSERNGRLPASSERNGRLPASGLG